MELQIFNTLSGKKEVFEPIRENAVGMYVCGVTVYDYCHVGHARSGVVFDTIFRYLKHCGYDVTYVRNFTDIEETNYILENDNIINIRAKEINLRLLNKKEIKENKLKWQLINTLLPIFIISVIISLLLLKNLHGL